LTNLAGRYRLLIVRIKLLTAIVKVLLVTLLHEREKAPTVRSFRRSVVVCPRHLQSALVGTREMLTSIFVCGPDAARADVIRRLPPWQPLQPLLLLLWAMMARQTVAELFARSTRKRYSARIVGTGYGLVGRTVRAARQTRQGATDW